MTIFINLVITDFHIGFTVLQYTKIVAEIKLDTSVLVRIGEVYYYISFYYTHFYIRLKCVLRKAWTEVDSNK